MHADTQTTHKEIKRFLVSDLGGKILKSCDISLEDDSIQFLGTDIHVQLHMESGFRCASVWEEAGGKFTAYPARFTLRELVEDLQEAGVSIQREKSFREWRKTGVDVEDIATHKTDEYDFANYGAEGRGRCYKFGGVIHREGHEGYYVIIGNEGWDSENLEEIERRLFGFFWDEGCFE